MLVLPIKRNWLDMIVAGEKLEEYRDITDYWTKRFVNLLGESEDHTKIIVDNLRKDRIRKECEVCLQNGYNPDGSPQAIVKVTLKIGTGRQEWGAVPGVEYFVLSIREIVEVKNMEKAPAAAGAGTAEEAQDSGAVFKDSQPAVIRKVQKTGFCKYCHQARMVEVPETLPDMDVNDVATEECDCDDARRQRERRARMEAAGLWAKNTFSAQAGQLQVALCAIRSTFEGAVDFVTIKIGKRTHKIDTGPDGMIRIRTTFRDSNEETF